RRGRAGCGGRSGRCPFLVMKRRRGGGLAPPDIGQAHYDGPISGGTSRMESYAIAGGEGGKRRLNLLAEIMRPTTLRFLEEVGIRRGGRCLDLGCGGGHVTLDLARIVGPQGRA